VKGDMFGLVAFNLILWLFRARMMCVAVNIKITPTDANDLTADVPGLGIPTHMVADFEIVAHGISRGITFFEAAQTKLPHPSCTCARIETAQF
jgi:hypothetical protein